MRLSNYEKTGEMFQKIKTLHDASFVPPERAPEMALRHVFDTGDVFIKGLQSRPIAFAIVTVDAAERYIWVIATREESRGHGIGAELLDEITGYYWAQHEPSIALTVNANNPAQKLYFDKGFRVVKFIPRRYRDVAGLRMRRNLL